MIADLEATRWTGRPGYPLRAMIGMALVKSIYAIPTWTPTVRLVRDLIDEWLERVGNGGSILDPLRMLAEVVPSAVEVRGGGRV